jgi:hypothetical protein
MGRGGRSGAGRGWRHQFNATGQPGWQRTAATPPAIAQVPLAAAAEERLISALKDQTELLQRTFNLMQKRIEELEAKTKPE